jgi:hypothetical protein
MVVMFQVEVFWAVMLCSVVVGTCCLHLHFTSFHPDDGGSMDLRKVGILPQHYTASQPRRRLEKLRLMFKI